MAYDFGSSNIVGRQLAEHMKECDNDAAVDCLVRFALDEADRMKIKLHGRTHIDRNDCALRLLATMVVDSFKLDNEEW